MLDWFVLLTPLLVLPIVLLFVFVGCPLAHPALRRTLTLNLSLSNETAERVTQVEFLVFPPGARMASDMRTITAPGVDGRFTATVPLTDQTGTWQVECRVSIERAGSRVFAGQVRQPFTRPAAGTSTMMATLTQNVRFALAPSTAYPEVRVENR